VGGGPAGVVEFIKLNIAGAGVVDPAGAEVVGLLVEAPPNRFPPVCLFKLELKIAVAGVDVVFWPLAGVPVSFFFCPKLKAPPDGELDAPAVLVIPPLEVEMVVVPAVFPNMPPPVVPPPPNREGVDVPETGFDPAFPPPKGEDVWAAPVLAPSGLAAAGVLPPKRPRDADFVVAVEF